MNSFIEQIIKNGHYDKANVKDNVEISANTNTLKSKMIINNNCEFDFRGNNSINSLLGFDSKLYTSGFNESENVVKILQVLRTQTNEIRVLSDCLAWEFEIVLS